MKKLDLKIVPKMNAFIDPVIQQFDGNQGQTSKTDDAKQMQNLILQKNAVILRNVAKNTLGSADVVNYHPVESEKSKSPSAQQIK